MPSNIILIQPKAEGRVFVILDHGNSGQFTIVRDLTPVDSIPFLLKDPSVFCWVPPYAYGIVRAHKKIGDDVSAPFWVFDVELHHCSQKTIMEQDTLTKLQTGKPIELVVEARSVTIDGDPPTVGIECPVGSGAIQEAGPCESGEIVVCNEVTGKAECGPPGLP